MPPLKKYAGCPVTRCLSASGLNCLFVFLLSFFASFPLCGVNSEKVSFGVLPPSFLAPPNQTTRIRSSNCNMCQTALNLEPRPPLSVRPLPVSGVSTDQSDLSSSKRRERRALAVAAAAVAIEVITEGWNCRLWNRALPGRARWKRRRGSRSGKSKHRIIHRSVRTPERRAEPRKKEVRTICLAERHQLVWPALPFCQAPGNQSKMNSSSNCSPFSLSLLSDSASRPRDAPLNKTASFNACLSQ